jgi:hypothetical protein
VHAFDGSSESSEQSQEAILASEKNV